MESGVSMSGVNSDVPGDSVSSAFVDGVKESSPEPVSKTS